MGKPGSKGVEAERPPLASVPTGGNAQAQEDEREVLKAIYMEDFQEVEAKGAWSVRLLLLSDSSVHYVEALHFRAMGRSLEHAITDTALENNR
jgi:hypothetical protein